MKDGELGSRVKRSPGIRRVSLQPGSAVKLLSEAPSCWTNTRARQRAQREQSPFLSKYLTKGRNSV